MWCAARVCGLERARRLIANRASSRGAGRGNLEMEMEMEMEMKNTRMRSARRRARCGWDKEGVPGHHPIVETTTAHRRPVGPVARRSSPPPTAEQPSAGQVGAWAYITFLVITWLA